MYIKYKKIKFALFLTLLSVAVVGVGWAVATDETKDFNTSHIHVNLKCKGCLTKRVTNAGCAIFKDKKLLLVKHRFIGKWGFPGGRDNLKGELAFQTAYRETKEETGLIVSIEDLITEFENHFRLFKCNILKETNKFDKKEITEIRYFSKEEILELMKEHKKELRYSHEFDVLYPQFDKFAKNS